MLNYTSLLELLGLNCVLYSGLMGKFDRIKTLEFRWALCVRKNSCVNRFSMWVEIWVDFEGLLEI